MKIDKRFLKQVLVIFCAGLGLAAYPLAKFGSHEIILATIAGALLGTVNVLLGYAAIEYSLDKSYTTFIKAVVGGMGLRIMIMVVALVVLIKIFDLHALALTISLLGFYVAYLVQEVLFIQKRFGLKTQS